MIMYESEESLLADLANADRILRECAAGSLGFEAFTAEYDGFYWRAALDGHESDQEELAILRKYSGRIEPHRFVAEEILGKVCSEADAKLEAYIQAGRFGPDRAIEMIREVVARLAV